MINKIKSNNKSNIHKFILFNSNYNNNSIFLIKLLFIIFLYSILLLIYLNIYDCKRRYIKFDKNFDYMNMRQILLRIK